MPCTSWDVFAHALASALDCRGMALCLHRTICVLCVVLFMRCWNFECPAPPDVCVCTSYGRRVVLLLARVSPHRTVQRVLRAELGGGPGRVLAAIARVDGAEHTLT